MWVSGDGREKAPVGERERWWMSEEEDFGEGV
jgi:hypothetical protein